MKYLSLFTGIGAPEKALKNLGIDFELVGFSEIDKYAAKAYCAIHDVDESMNLGDITKIDETVLPKDIGLITYGFPCQDISVAGKGKGLFNEDGTQTRSGLFFDALRIIEATQPRIAIAENVKNLTGKKFKEQFELILNCLESAGYNNYWKVLNAKDYGIPQNRERVFIVSIRKDIDDGQFKFPEPFPLELRLKDMLEEKVDEKFYLSDKAMQNLVANGNFNCNPSGKGMNGKVHNGDIAPTLTTNKGEGPKFLETRALLLDRSMVGLDGEIREYEEVSPTITAREYKEPRLINESRLREINQAVGCAIRNRENGPQLEIRKDELLSALHGNIEKSMVIHQVAQLYPNSGNPQAGRVYDADGISPAMDTCQGGNRMPKIVDPIIYDDYNNRIKADQTVIGTLTTNIGSSTPRNDTKIIEAFCCASRGRNPENPTDRTPGLPTEQRLEVRQDGLTNTITTVQKDNYVMIREATKKGYAEATEGDFVNIGMPNSQTRRVRVGKGIANTLTTMQEGAVVVDDNN